MDFTFFLQVFLYQLKLLCDLRTPLELPRMELAFPLAVVGIAVPANLPHVLLRSCLITASLIRRYNIQGVISLPSFLLCSSDVAKALEDEALEQAGAG